MVENKGLSLKSLFLTVLHGMEHKCHVQYSLRVCPYTYTTCHHDILGKASNYLIFLNIYSTCGYMFSVCSTSN